MTLATPRPEQGMVAALRAAFSSLVVSTELLTLKSVPAGAHVLLVDVQSWDPTLLLLELRRCEGGAAAPPLPILGFAANAGEEERARALEGGCTAYLASAEPAVVVPTALLCLASGQRARVPPEVADVAGDYLAARRADALALELLLDRGDFAELRRIAHRMRGSGSGYGFEVVSVAGRMLEDAAERRDALGARSWTAKLSAYLAHVEITFA